jgi:TPR repeat protein
MNRHLEKTSQPVGMQSNKLGLPLDGIARRRAAHPGLRTLVRHLSALLLGLALLAAASTAARADSGEEKETGRVADLGYADVIAPLRAAAKDNDVRAQETLGFMYLCAESRCAPGIARDLEEARYWLSRAAAQGSMVAAYQLAWLRGEARPAFAAKQD